MCPTAFPDIPDSLTSGRAFPTIRASSEFPGSSVVERRTVNPLVGGSNPSRGATCHFPLTSTVCQGPPPDPHISLFQWVFLLKLTSINVHQLRLTATLPWGYLWGYQEVISGDTPRVDTPRCHSPTRRNSRAIRRDLGAPYPIRDNLILNDRNHIEGRLCRTIPFKTAPRQVCAYLSSSRSPGG
jgi:hypothetical protein